LLTDISVDWNGLPVSDVYPKRIPDLFGAKPVILTGRYTGAAQGTLRLRGKMAGSDYVREIPVQFPESEKRHDVLATLWARTRIDDLMGQDYGGAQQGTMKAELKQTITQLGLEYRLMTQFTSFVAVEEMVVNQGGQQRTVEVPIEMPEGVSYQGVFGDGSGAGAAYVAAPKAMARRVAVRGGVLRGTGRVAADEAVVVTDGPGRRPAMTKEEQRRQKIAARVHPAILAVIDRLQDKKGRPGPEEARFVHDNRAEVQVWLDEKTPAILTQLKQLGFEVELDPKGAKMVIGRLPIGKLAALADLAVVRYVAPSPGVK
jgi:Ca-activated chloride channel homolog